MIITSTSNDKVKEIKKLIKSASFRNEKGMYVVEGIRMFREIPEDDIIEAFVSESKLEALKSEIDKKTKEYTVVSEKVFNAMSDTGTPQGILALVKIKRKSCVEVLENANEPIILLLENIQDPGNLGTIIRTAEGAGVSCIIMNKNSVDLYNTKVIRSTMGSIFRMTVIISEDFMEDILMLKSRGITVYGAHLKGQNLYEKNLKKASAFLIGNEGNGLTDEISNMADDLIKIPMMGKVESLNAAISATIISYEALRQRL